MLLIVTDVSDLYSSHDDDDRKGQSVRSCTPSWRGWADYCESHGITLTALHDAIGHCLADSLDQGREQIDMVEAVKLARRIVVYRLRRGDSRR